MIDLTKPDCRKAALGALQTILASRQRAIQVTKSDNPDSNLNKLKFPGNVQVVEPSKTDEEEAQEKQDLENGKTPEEIKQAQQQAQAERVKKIANDFDPNSEETQKDIDNIVKDTEMRRAQAQQAKRKEIERRQREIQMWGTVEGFASFAGDLHRSIKSQITISRKPEDTYSRVNPVYANTDLLMPGQGEVEKREIPTIRVYFDTSGSMKKYINKTLNAIECLATYKRKGLVKYDTFYFADRLSNHRDNNGTGTSGFGFVMEDIRNSKCKNAIIVTDDDIERQTQWQSDFRTTKIELLGCVWWLWPSENDRSHTAFKRLVGKRGVFQYIL